MSKVQNISIFLYRNYNHLRNNYWGAVHTCYNIRTDQSSNICGIRFQDRRTRLFRTGEKFFIPNKVLSFDTCMQ